MARWKSFKNKAGECFYCWDTVEELRERGIYMTVDHVVPRGKGGTDDPENLVSACERCNNMKDSDDGWYEGCVALEAFGRPEWFRDMLRLEQERGIGNGKCLERHQEESEGRREPQEQ